MTKQAAVLAALLVLAGCAGTGQPRLGVGIGIGPGGVSLVPRVTTTLRGVTVGATPGGASVGTKLGPVSVGTAL